MDEVHAGGHQDLRRNSLPTAWLISRMKDDFRLPEMFSQVSGVAHSSPLRIFGPITLWLHDDVSYVVTVT